MLKLHSTIYAAAIFAIASLSGCGDADSAFSASDNAPGNWQGADTSTGWSDSSTGSGDTSQPPPPENEVDFDLRTPEASDQFLFVPSAALDALIAVDASTLRVHLIEAGLSPTIVRALPDGAGAIVLNEGSSDVTLVRQDPGETVSFSKQFFPVAAGATRLVLSPDGAWAFAWYDERFGEGYARRGNFGSLQDVSAIHLVPGQEAVYNLAVGYRPTEVQFADDDKLLLVECEDGLSTTYLEDLVKDTFLPPVQTTDDVFVPPLEREIIPGPDGTFVAVRDLQYRRLLWIDLETGGRLSLELPDFPSDLDMTPDGTRLLVPLRELQQVAIVTIPEAFTWEAPTPVEPLEGEEPEPLVPNPYITYVDTGAPFGSLALTADAGQALLFTTQAGVAAIGMLNVAAETTTIRPMIKELESVAIDPTGKVAALLHRRLSGTGSIAEQNAYSLLDLTSGYAKLVIIPNPVSMFTFTSDGAELFALVPDPLGNQHAVHRVISETFAIQTYSVPDRPTFVGAMPMVSKMAISLDNPTGWITFIDTTTNEVRQLNSFELNGFVR